MKIAYYPETDSMYIELSENASIESEEVSPGVVLDYDEEGHLVGIDIDNAKKQDCSYRTDSEQNAYSAANHFCLKCYDNRRR